LKTLSVITLTKKEKRFKIRVLFSEASTCSMRRVTKCLRQKKGR